MYSIRESVFETNSSSSHSVAIKSRKEKNFSDNNQYGIEELKDYIENDGYLHIDLEEFGWGPETYADPYYKLSYLLCMLMCVNGIGGWCNDSPDRIRSDLERTKEWEEINEFIVDLYNCNGIYIDDCSGYIDHQSYEDYRSVRDFLNDYDVSIDDFLFNSNVKLIIDNDNH